jgi:hypothetical protein
VQEDGVRIRVHGVFEEITQIAGLLRVERLAIIVRLELVEHRELTDLVEFDASQLAWYGVWKDPLFVTSHAVRAGIGE